MAFKFMWRELTGDGRLLDPDETIAESRGYSRVHASLFNTYTGGHDTEEDAVSAYERAIDNLRSWELPANGLVLLKVYQL